MSQPADGIPYDLEKVLRRAYARIGELTLQVDQLTAALEHAQAQGAPTAGAALDLPRPPAA